VNLPSELQTIKDEIESYALEFGLDFFPMVFEVVDFRLMNEVASYCGFPSRYPHWRFGMEYESMEKGYAYGLHKIYEMVINNNPCYAYFLKSNKLVDQKTVMAHVYAHCDFFKNNLCFSKTNRKMIDEMANHGSRIQRYINKYGIDRVEGFLDACLSIEELIDYHTAAPEKKSTRRPASPEDRARNVKKLKSKGYMDNYINPKDFMEKQKQVLEDEDKKEKKFPERPERDVLLFIIENAPLENWENHILSMIREESYYFAPQWQTKIMNEGWATYWHSHIMTQRALTDAELIDYADHHSGTLGSRPGRVNPYKIGMEIFRDIEERWDKGQFGKEYEECDDLVKKKEWNNGYGKGLEKIFEVRRLYNDVTFIDTFLTEEFCREQKLFTYSYNQSRGVYEIGDRDFQKVKEKFLFSLTNMGRPIIYVEDGNYKNRGDLYLRHQHEGIDLKIDHAKDTLRNVHLLWRRPVHLETVINGTRELLTYEDDKHTVQKI
jgi:stage V sporulation protein R